MLLKKSSLVTIVYSLPISFGVTSFMDGPLSSVTSSSQHLELEEKKNKNRWNKSTMKYVKYLIKNVMDIPY